MSAPASDTTLTGRDLAELLAGVTATDGTSYLDLLVEADDEEGAEWQIA
ncbi:hypothetical protein [Kitasatospora sp. NPDC056731]